MSSKTKQLHKYMLHKLVVLEGNMEQWATVDAFIGEEMRYRLDQALALRQGETERAVAVHQKRVACLEQALAVLRTCPACQPPVEGTP